MPCRTEEHYDETSRLSKELNRVTQYLCHIMGCLEKGEDPLPSNPSLIDWWKQHKAYDLKREQAAAREKELRANALATRIQEDQRELDKLRKQKLRKKNKPFKD